MCTVKTVLEALTMVDCRTNTKQLTDLTIELQPLKDEIIQHEQNNEHTGAISKEGLKLFTLLL